MSHDPHRERRWSVLVAASAAQLMVVLDATITNIALPSAQAELGFGAGTRQWVVTAYALAFGSLLLLGGRLGDLAGRKRAFVGGLAGFATASAVGGASSSLGMLVGARAAQGAFAALLAPAALALVGTRFADPRERARAFGVFGGVASAGGGLGVVLGGVLTQSLSWRWCLYVNVLFAIPVAVAGLRLLGAEVPAERRPLDLPGAAAATAGLFALVYGLATSEANGWGHPVTVGALAAAVVLVGTFVRTERRAAHPLLPMRVVADRTRAGAFVAVLVAGSAIFAAALFLTFYLQQNRGLTPVETGLRTLPLPATIMVSAPSVSAVLLARVGPRALMVFGLSAGAVAMMWFTRLEQGSNYATAILPGLVVLGLAMATVNTPAFATATRGVDPTDAGVASAMVNTMLQVGGAVGTALLGSIFAGAVARHLHGTGRTPDALDAASIHGYAVAFRFAAGAFAVGALVVGALVRPIRVVGQGVGDVGTAATGSEPARPPVR